MFYLLLNKHSFKYHKNNFKKKNFFLIFKLYLSYLFQQKMSKSFITEHIINPQILSDFQKKHLIQRDLWLYEINISKLILTKDDLIDIFELCLTVDKKIKLFLREIPFELKDDFMDILKNYNINFYQIHFFYGDIKNKIHENQLMDEFEKNGKIIDIKIKIKKSRPFIAKIKLVF